MSRSELVAILTDLLTRQIVTAETFAAILQQYDDGTLLELPLSMARQEDGDGWQLALLLLLLLMNGADVGAMSRAERGRTQRLLRRQYEDKVARLAAGVVTTSTIPTWQAGMIDSVELYARQMAIAGAGTLPGITTRGAVDERLSGQWPFLARFAVVLLAGKVAGKLMSEAAIRSRSELYGGTGWGAYYLGQGEGAAWGYVDQWITRDDRKVCDRCGPRHRQYFLPGRPPFPGWDCRGSCRCKRVRVYNPAVYARLGGR